jgi:DNA-binding ferritin-like protein (Dps family)
MKGEVKEMEKLILEADRLSKELKIDFRDILDYLYIQNNTNMVLTAKDAD